LFFWLPNFFSLKKFYFHFLFVKNNLLTFLRREVFIPLSFCEKRKWRKKITALARAGANSLRGLAKIIKNDVAP